MEITCGLEKGIDDVSIEEMGIVDELSAGVVSSSISIYIYVRHQVNQNLSARVLYRLDIIYSLVILNIFVMDIVIKGLYNDRWPWPGCPPGIRVFHSAHKCSYLGLVIF